LITVYGLDRGVQTAVAVPVALGHPVAAGRPYSAPTTASASALSRALIIICRGERFSRDATTAAW